MRRLRLISILLVGCFLLFSYQAVDYVRASDSVDTYVISYPEGLYAGDIFDLSVTINNTAQIDMAAESYTLWAPAFIGFIDVPELEFGVIKPGASQTSSVSAIALEGGSESVYLYKGTSKVAETAVKALGRGYYAGDNHTHSKFSDGDGTVTQNALSSIGKGLDFMTATDHNKVTQRSEINVFNQGEYG